MLPKRNFFTSMVSFSATFSSRIFFTSAATSSSLRSQLYCFKTDKYLSSDSLYCPCCCARTCSLMLLILNVTCLIIKVLFFIFRFYSFDFGGASSFNFGLFTPSILNHYDPSISDYSYVFPNPFGSSCRCFSGALR